MEVGDEIGSAYDHTGRGIAGGTKMNQTWGREVEGRNLKYGQRTYSGIPETYRYNNATGGRSGGGRGIRVGTDKGL